LNDLFGSTWFNIFLFASAISTFGSLLVGISRSKRRVFLSLNAGLMIALAVFASYSLFQYQTIRSAEAVAARHRAMARADARELLHSLPSCLFLEPGVARGVAVAGLAYLEQYSDLYPETFKLAQDTVRADIELARNAESSVDEAQKLQVAGEMMLAILKGLAGEGE